MDQSFLITNPINGLLTVDKPKRLAALLKEKRMSKGTLDNPGNFLYGLLDLINAVKRPDMNIVEIGSYEGATAELFSLTSLGDSPRLTCVDPWGDGEEFGQESRDDLIRAEAVFKDRMQYYPHTVYKMKSWQAVDKFGFESIDLFYDDGDHRAMS